MPKISSGAIVRSRILFVLVVMLFGSTEILAANSPCLTPAQLSQERPNREQGPTRVLTALYILDISDISDQNQQFTADLVIEMHWQDPRLAAESSQCRYNLDAIWHPRLQIFNQRTVTRYAPEQVEVDAKGNVVYNQRYYGTFSNRLDLRKFPFDQQTLTFSLISFYLNTEVQLVFNEGLTGMDKNSSISGWQVSNPSATVDDYSTHSSHATQENEKFSRLRYSLQAGRDINYYRWKILLPLVLIVVLSWTVFWIDPSQVGPQLATAATAMLTLIAFLFSLRGILPPISYLTYMDFFVYGSLALVFLTSIESIITSNLAQTNKLELAIRLDLWSRLIFPGLFLFLVVYYWL